MRKKVYCTLKLLHFVVHQRKIVEIRSYGIFCNIWTAFVIVSQCAATWVSVAFCSGDFVQLNDTRVQENNHFLRRIEHSTRCGIKYSTVVLEFVLNMFLPIQAIQVSEGTRSQYTVKPFTLILFPRLLLLFICWVLASLLSDMIS